MGSSSTVSKVASQVQPGKGGAEHGPGMSGWAGLLKTAPLSLRQNRQQLEALLGTC